MRRLTWTAVVLGLLLAAPSCDDGGDGVATGVSADLCGSFQTQLPGGSSRLPGVWRGSFTDQFGTAGIELILQQNGSFSEQSAYLGGALITITGSYRTFGTPRILRLDIQHGEPTESCGPLGCDPIVYPAGETHCYGFPNATTMILRNAYCQPGTCDITYTKVN